MERPENMELTLKDSASTECSKKPKSLEEKQKKKKKATKKDHIEHQFFPQQQQQQQQQSHHIIQQQQISEEEKKEKQKEKLQKIIDDFVRNESKEELHCSSELTSYERMVLHELAGEAQLSHASEGEGKNRHIVLRKSFPHKVNRCTIEKRKI